MAYFAALSLEMPPCCVSVLKSVVMPMYNASPWLDECLQAVVDQDFTGNMELSVFDDASTVSALAYLHR